MKVILPCCGRSSRFPNQPPKWMLPAHDGRPMLSLALSQLDVSLDDVLITVLREHETKFHVTEGIRTIFGGRPRVIVLDEPTRSQSETVARTLEASGLAEPFLVKDSDNTYVLAEIEQPYNYVCCDSLNHFDSINPRNKSYLQVDHAGLISNIREKVVISDLFNVGGYYFTDPAAFLEAYRRLSADAASWQRELYLSDVIGAMILAGVPFRARHVTGYRDWGTIVEWRRALLSRRTYFVLLDGFLFERGSAYFQPRFADVRPRAAALDAVRKARDEGHTVICLSIRPPELASLTAAQLAAAGLEGAQVVYGCPISPWTLVTSPDPTTPFQTSLALELAADDPNLEAKLLMDG